MPVRSMPTFRYRRHQVAVLVFLGLMTNYMMRTNINIALEEMTDRNSSLGLYLNWTDYGGSRVSETNAEDAKDFVKSAFFIGYVITQVPGGRMTETFGTKKVLGHSLFICALLCAVTPLICYINLSTSLTVGLLFVIRVVQGLCEGVSYPALTPTVAKWSPDSERGLFLAFCYMGGTFGAVLAFPLCGLIMEYMNWTWVFYIISLITVVWYITWMLLMSDDPQNDKLITEDERDEILRTRPFNSKQQAADLATPVMPLLWDILKTPVVWVCVLCDFCNGFGLYVLLSEGPGFVRDVLPIGKDIYINGLLSSTPSLARLIFAQVAGYASDFLIGREYLSKLQTQKLSTCIAFLLPGAGMIVMTFFTTSDWQYVCVALLALSFGFNGAVCSGHVQNIISLAPNRSGTLYGVSNGLGNLSGFIVPFVKSWTVRDITSIDEWRNLFIVAASLYTLATVVFCIFATGEAQHFNSKEYRISQSSVPPETSSDEETKPTETTPLLNI